MSSRQQRRRSSSVHHPRPATSSSGGRGQRPPMSSSSSSSSFVLSIKNNNNNNTTPNMVSPSSFQLHNNRGAVGVGVLGGITPTANGGGMVQGRRSMSVPRRMSLAPSSYNNNNRPSMMMQQQVVEDRSSLDRRAMLDEWRAKKPPRGPTTSASSPATTDGYLTTTTTPAGGGVLSSPTVTSGSTALERYRIRRRLEQQQQQEKQNDHMMDSENIPPSSSSSQASIEMTSLPSSTTKKVSSTPPTSISGNTSPSFDEFDDNDENNASTIGSTRRMSSSTSSRRGRSSSRRTSRRQTLMPSQLQNISSGSDSSSSAEMEKSSSSTVVEDAGLRSQVREMQQRIDQLEQDKMLLKMSKAPLEARLQQREETFKKEHQKIMHELDASKEQARECEERYRDSQAQLEAKEMECMKLREQLRNTTTSQQHNSSSASGGAGGAAAGAGSGAGGIDVDDDITTSAWSNRVRCNEQVLEVEKQLNAAEKRETLLRSRLASCEKENHILQIELQSTQRALEQVSADYDALSESTSNNQEAEIKLQFLSEEHIAMSAQLNAVCTDLASTKAKSEAATEALEEQHKKEVDDLMFEISILKTKIAEGPTAVGGDANSESNLDDIAVLQATLEKRDRKIAELENQVLQCEIVRRQMHNRIQELRGNVRVFVRTRPFLPSDGNNKSNKVSAIDVMPDGESLSIIDNNKRSNNGVGSHHSFKFDKAFPPSSGQDHIFEEVSDFVQSALDGYHVCLFSYGQTGSGKTHTMQGSGTGAMRGIIPRAVEQILCEAQNLLKNQKWDYKLNVSFLEIYNEELKDLLVSYNNPSNNNSSTSMRNHTGGSNNNTTTTKLSIKRSREGKSYVEGLTEVPIDVHATEGGMEQLDRLMAVAARARSVATTKMNAQSSRSHSVFMLHLHGQNAESGVSIRGTLNLCDLAGSERLERSGAASDAKRLRETQAINKSLSCLGDVFNALAQGSRHVPYRNSKLTYLLQDCLSGDGKALMFVNLSPTLASCNESLCSLRFAQRVNSVELGKPTKHIQYS